MIEIPPSHDVPNACAEEVDSQKRSAKHESEEVAVVPPADAVVEPDAVMVLSLDTIIAYSAVVAARWTPDIACLAVFGRNLECTIRCGVVLYDYPLGHGWSWGKRIGVVGNRWVGVKISGEYLTVSRATRGIGDLLRD